MKEKQCFFKETKNEGVTEAITTAVANRSDSTSTDSDNEPDGKENFFENQSRFSQFEAFASDQPLNTPGIDSITAGIDNEFDESPQIQELTEQQSEILKSTGGDDEPWELEDSGEERIKNLIQKNDSYNNFFPNTQTSASIPAATTEETGDEENTDEDEKDNYDDYFSKNQPIEHGDTSPPRIVRFDDNIENVAVVTPKDSLDDQSESPDTPNDFDEDITTNLQTVSDRITDYMHAKEISNKNEPTEMTMHNSIPRPDSEISLTDSEDLPPPLPPLPPLNKKSSHFCSFLLYNCIYLFKYFR